MEIRLCLFSIFYNHFMQRSHRATPWLGCGSFFRRRSTPRLPENHTYRPLSIERVSKDNWLDCLSRFRCYDGMRYFYLSRETRNVLDYLSLPIPYLSTRYRYRNSFRVVSDSPTTQTIGFEYIGGCCSTRYPRVM